MTIYGLEWLEWARKEITYQDQTGLKDLKDASGQEKGWDAKTHEFPGQTNL